MKDSALTEDHFYILATSTRAGQSSPVLKKADTFAVMNPHGDMLASGLSEHGLYHDGTRFLSRLQLRIARRRPLLLSSGATDHNDLFTADLTNPDISEDGHVNVPRNVLHIARSRLLRPAACLDRITLVSFAEEPLSLSIHFEMEADFADIFEVRGTHREKRGELLPALVQRSSVELRYRGLDSVVRATRLSWSLPPKELSAGAARFDLDFTRGQPHTLDLAITCHVTGPEAEEVQRPEPAKHHPAPSASIERDFDAAVSAAEAQSRAEASDFCEVSASNRELHRWLNHAVADVRMMCTATDFGPYPYAGVPWYNTAFGRDGIVTALELLWLNPRIARGVLGYLASMQATTVDPQNDAEPGKILHETRGGEMAALGEVPFRRYYGSVDATPLFLCLAGAYYQRTGDLDLIRSLWPSIERAMEWIERYGDADGDGFVEYSRRSAEGLEQQGWKDSHDSVFHADGSLAKPPIALVEVQSYVYSARNSVALLADRLGLARVGEVQRARADALRERFEEAFWCPSMASYGLALDGDKRLCRVHTSNAGHALFGGIARDVRARLVARDLAKPHLFSGWGVRTLSSAAPRYNPMSYHNGSVWPHDNALIAAGLSRYGLTKLILATFQGLFEASQFMPSRRMPELFCGFARRAPEGPTLYPVACSPQSWAAGAPLWLLQSCLGLSIDGPARRVRIKKPRLPDLAPEITLRNLEVSQGRTLDLRFDRHGDDVSVTVLRRDRKIQVAIVK